MGYIGESGSMGHEMTDLYKENVKYAIMAILDCDSMKQVTVQRETGYLFFDCVTETDVHSFMLNFDDGFELLAFFMRDERVRIKIW